MVEKRIRIGNQTAPSAIRPFEPFEYAVVNGFDAFEWFLDGYGVGDGWEGADLDGEARQELRRKAAQNDISMSVHAPWWLDPFDRSGNELLRGSLAFALDVGATNLNIHLSPEKGMEAFVRTLIPFLRTLADLPLHLSIENIPSTGPENFNELFPRLADTGLPIEGRVGMCLDLGHANLYPPTRNDYLGFLDRLGANVPIIHLHLHENWGNDDSHLPLFSGPSAEDASGIVGFVDRMKGRGFSGSIILEQWPDPPSLLNQARDRLTRMFASSPSSAAEDRAF
jgi:sugar phosphate isomerase/epimerase